MLRFRLFIFADNVENPSIRPHKPIQQPQHHPILAETVRTTMPNSRRHRCFIGV
jgi:hypothetical protein